MNIQRAQEISSSPEMKHVYYNDVAVYIQAVDPENSTARIYDLRDTENEMTVNVGNLIEK
ncbi:H-type small acid-soluble spore protein [Bacillus sp. FJAT-44742]|uniref:H-type small acid-soluble spore protein n=1 Tax=Bacillus sp. FJAT-44742 TaxID=2014005 RepID=UPI000C245260|nr:H-type small acid-soluble spore protein [Bacillus sp. FJAT-44742]